MIFNRLTVLGNMVEGSLETVETFEAPAGIVRVTMTSDEVVSHCPVTGQKDLYTVSIMYVPDGMCIESKSLKLYLDHFMTQGIFAETLATTICNDLCNACQPVSCAVVVRQKSRGGIVIEVQAEKHAPPQGYRATELS